MTMQTYTFAAAVRAYIAELAARRHNRSAGRDARFLNRHLLDPANISFLNKPIADVTDGDILGFLHALGDRPALAGKCAREMRAFLAWAMRPPRRQKFGLRSNPALHILPRHIAGRAQARLRFLDVDELLHAYLAAAATLKPHQRAFVEALALTGQRPSELRRIRWSELPPANQPDSPGAPFQIRSRPFNRKGRNMTRHSHTFAAALRMYIAELPERRHNRSASRDAIFLERHLLDPAKVPFTGKPIADVTDGEILGFLCSVRDRPELARKCTQKIRAFFAWAMWPPRREEFGLKTDPALYILPRHIAGRPVRPRHRFLDVDELHAYLAAATTLKPHQQALAEALALTGDRPSKLGRMRWSELDLDRKVWTAPRGNGAVALVALPDAFAARLTEMRRNLPAGAGDFVFSATQGRTPLLHLGRMKSALGREMRRILGHPPASPSDWRWLDLRRTVICMVLDCATDPGDAFRDREDSDETIIREALNRHADALDSIMQRHRAAAANLASGREGRIIQFPVRPREPDHAGDA